MPNDPAPGLLLTTPVEPSPQLLAEAQGLAERLQLPYVPRRRSNIGRLVARHGLEAALLVDDDGLHLVRDGQRFGFHPNMAVHRLRALATGGTDRLVRLAGLRPGDRLLDATCGLASDAMVAAAAVGPRGEVLALEASAVLCAIVQRGLQTYVHRDAAVNGAMRRVTVRHADHTVLLPTLESGSWDVVYLDPMFENTQQASQGVDLLRRLGATGLPDRALLDEARRVARRCVLVKDRKPGLFLRAMGIPVVSTSGRVWYGRIDAA